LLINTVMSQVTTKTSHQHTITHALIFGNLLSTMPPTLYNNIIALKLLYQSPWLCNIMVSEWHHSHDKPWGIEIYRYL